MAQCQFNSTAYRGSYIVLLYMNVEPTVHVNVKCSGPRSGLASAAACRAAHSANINNNVSLAGGSTPVRCSTEQARYPYATVPRSRTTVRSACGIVRAVCVRYGTIRIHAMHTNSRVED